jgi:hypothetical protein
LPVLAVSLCPRNIMRNVIKGRIAHAALYR